MTVGAGEPIIIASIQTISGGTASLGQDQVDAIDFGLGGDAYKADWMDRSAPVLRLRAFEPASPRGLLRYARAQAAALVRRVRSR